MEFLFGAGLLGLSLAFWIVAIVGFLIVTALANNESFAKSIGWLAIFGVALLYLAGVGLGGAWHFIANDPWALVRWFGYYIAIGILYGTVRWWSKIMRVRNKLIRFRNRENIPNGTKMTQDQKTMFLSSINERYYQEIPLRVRDNKARITYWMTFWPVSLPISLRPLTRLIDFIYDQIAGFLQNISNRAFRDLA